MVEALKAVDRPWDCRVLEGTGVSPQELNSFSPQPRIPLMACGLVRSLALVQKSVDDLAIALRSDIANKSVDLFHERTGLADRLSLAAASPRRTEIDHELLEADTECVVGVHVLRLALFQSRSEHQGPALNVVLVLHLLADGAPELDSTASLRATALGSGEAAGTKDIARATGVEEGAVCQILLEHAQQLNGGLPLSHTIRRRLPNEHLRCGHCLLPSRTEKLTVGG